MNNAKVMIQEIDEILWQDWDPIGINDEPTARDEYASYVIQVYGLLRQGAGSSQIERLLKRIESEEMGVSGTVQEDLLPQNALCNCAEDKLGTSGLPLSSRPCAQPGARSSRPLAAKASRLGTGSNATLGAR